MLITIITQLFITLFSITLPGLDGKEINLARFKGKKILLVNTASQSALAGQLSELQQLQDKYAERLVVILIPSNNINGEEPLSNEEIKEYLEHRKIRLHCSAKLDVSVLSGHPLFQWLGSREKNGVSDMYVRGNFTKILIGPQGQPLEVFNPGVPPFSEAIVNAIER